MSAKTRVGRTGISPSLTKDQSGQQDTTASKSGADQTEHSREILEEQTEPESLVTQEESLVQANELEKLWQEALKDN